MSFQEVAFIESTEASIHETLETRQNTDKHRTGFKPVQPMQLHWAPRHGVWVYRSFLPDAPCA